MLYIFVVVVVILLLLLLEAATVDSVEKGVLEDFTDFMGERQCWSLFSINVQPDNLRLSCRVVKFLRASILRNVSELLLLYCCGFVLLFFML